MSLFSWISHLFDDRAEPAAAPMASADPISNPVDEFAINPATGLPMVNGIGGIDVAGNPYGTDLSHDQHHADVSPVSTDFSNDHFHSSDNSFSDW